MILASGSPRRADILRQVGIDVDVRPQDVDETVRAGERPTDLVARLSSLKVRAACAAASGADGGEVVVGADTIVWMGDVAFGKPADEGDAVRMLRALSGRTHHVSTGVTVALLDGEGRAARSEAFVETTDVTFFELGDAEILSYVATGEPLDKAGAYGYQARGCVLVRRIEGDYYNVVGLPVARLLRAIERLGPKGGRT